AGGTFLGRWGLDGDNRAPSGITRNPAGGSDLWVADRATRSVYRYAGAAGRRDGQAAAIDTFALGTGSARPEGIADPPVPLTFDPTPPPGGAPGLQEGGLGSFAQLPLSFEPNQGQADAGVRYLSRGEGYTLLLGDAEAVLRLGPAAPGPEGTG